MNSPTVPARTFQPGSDLSQESGGLPSAVGDLSKQREPSLVMLNRGRAISSSDASDADSAETVNKQGAGYLVWV